VLDGVDSSVRGADDLVEDDESGLDSERKRVLEREQLSWLQCREVESRKPTCSEASSTSVPTAFT